jgi:glycosyltransferase involved in cell wall biosynthesis
MTKVSICLPTYNRSHFLTYAAQSVFAQTYRDWELIICDDGSTDNTPEIVQQWQSSPSPRQIIYLRQKHNIGRSQNMQAGFRAAKGKYFIKFDDDDALTPEFLAKTVEILDGNPTVDFVCTNHWIIDAQGQRNEAATLANSQHWSKDKLPSGVIPDLLRETFQHQSLQVGSTLFRKSCLDQVGFMRSEADGCEDFDLLVRLSIANFQGYFLPEYLMEYRFHNAQSSLKQDIHFLSAKLFCLDSYNFSNPELAHVQQYKLAGTKQALAMRLLQVGESAKARRLIKESELILGKSRKTSIAYFLSWLPKIFIKLATKLQRYFRPQNYTDKVRI